MPPFIGNVTSLLADSFGGSSSIWGILFAVLTAQAIGLGAYMATKNMIVCLMATGVALLISSFMGFVPIWVCFIFFAMGGAFVILPIFRSRVSSSEEKKATKNKILCYFIQANGEAVEKWVSGDSRDIVFNGQRYGIDPSCINPKWYDKGLHKLFPIWVPALEFREGSAVPLSREEIEVGKEMATQTGMEVKGKGVMATPSYVAVSTTKQSSKNSQELILRIEKASQKWSEYHNNLDVLLGVTTFANWPLNIESRGKGLELSKLPFVHSLFIHNEYDWYISDKMIDQDIFKVVGLHKKDASKNLVYLLGKNKETGQPFLTPISSPHLEDDIEKCMDAKKENETNGLMVGLMMSTIGSAMLPSLIKGIVDGVDTKGVKR